MMLGWLYLLVRGNLKRGREFELGRALETGHADCLVLAQVLETLGRAFGLDIGIVEVVKDSAGRFVSHPTNLFQRADGRRQLVDLWYGTQDAPHRRLGVRVRAGRRWPVRDIEGSALRQVEEIRGLGPKHIAALTLYTHGNRHFNRVNWGEAIRCYTRAIQLYPENVRFYYNRGLAYEMKGEPGLAARDFARATASEEGMARLAAQEHEEVERLIGLDEAGIDLKEQGIYLLNRGFVTGSRVPPHEVAKAHGLSLKEVQGILSRIKAAIASRGGLRSYKATSPSPHP